MQYGNASYKIALKNQPYKLDNFSPHRLLRKVYEKMGDQCVDVSVADSGHQPRPSNSMGTTTNNPATAQQLSPFESLIDDCLHMILAYLEPGDVANLATTSQRLANFAANHFYPKYKSIQIRQRIPQETFQNMMFQFGDSVEHLTLSELRIREDEPTKVQCILTFCPNLKSLHLFDSTLRQNSLPEELNYRNSTLNTLHLGRCMGVTRRMLESWPNLRNIILERNSDIDGNSLLACDRLESLSLIYCSQLNDEKLIEVLRKNARTLKSLLILPKITPAIGRALVELLPGLQSFAFEWHSSSCCQNYNFADLSELQHLRRIQIYFRYQYIGAYLERINSRVKLEKMSIIDGLFDEETAHYFRKFETSLHWLRICHTKLMLFATIRVLIPLLDTVVLAIVKNLPKLARLDIVGMNCVSFEMVRLIVELLQADNEGGKHRRPHFTLNVEGAEELTAEQQMLLNSNRHLITYRVVEAASIIQWDDDDEEVTNGSYCGF